VAGAGSADGAIATSAACSGNAASDRLCCTSFSGGNDLDERRNFKLTRHNSCTCQQLPPSSWSVTVW
jgi:hypothetical protein